MKTEKQLWVEGGWTVEREINSKQFWRALYIANGETRFSTLIRSFKSFESFVSWDCKPFGTLRDFKMDQHLKLITHVLTTANWINFKSNEEVCTLSQIIHLTRRLGVLSVKRKIIISQVKIRNNVSWHKSSIHKSSTYKAFATSFFDLINGTCSWVWHENKTF